MYEALGTAWKETWLRNTNQRRKAVIRRMLAFEEGILQNSFFEELSVETVVEKEAYLFLL